MYKHFLKRLFDLVISLIALFCLSPFLVIIAVLVHFSNKGAGAFFMQDRPGKGEKVFRLIKFRTMTEETDQEGKLLPDQERLTKIGKFIRSASIDELPQLLNLIKGDMSLIGPRPLLVRYLPLYSTRQARRHEVRPGLTGWAQVNGRNTISWQQKFDYDVWYVDHLSFWLDMKIFFMTIVKIIRREGINSSASVSMEAFKGNG